MIKIEGLTKSFPRKGGLEAVFKDVNFTLNNDKSLAIFGEGGSGKSLLLNIIGKTDFPTKGKVRSTNNISWIMNLIKYENSMSLRQNVRFFCRLAGERNFKHVEEFVQNSLDLGDKFNRSVESITGPEKRAVALATTMALDFDTYLIDVTPFQGVQEQKDFWMGKLLEKKKTSNFIIAGPPPPIAKALCDVALVLEKEAAVFYDNIEEGIEAFNNLKL